jgi:hypothetical protein
MKSKLTRLLVTSFLTLSLGMSATMVFSAPVTGDRGRAGVGRDGVDITSRNREWRQNRPGLRNRDDLRLRERRFGHEGFRDPRYRYRYHRPRSGFYFRFGTPYYGYPYGYRDYGYGYRYYAPRPVQPVRPAWTPPAPVRVGDNAIAQWADRNTLQVTWTGSGTALDRLDVALLDVDRRTLKHRSDIAAPYVVNIDVDDRDRAAFLRVRSMRLTGEILSEVVTPLPAR